MTAFDELHPVVQGHIQRFPAGGDEAPCGCTFAVSPIYGRDVRMCRFHTGMSLGVDEALEWVEQEEIGEQW